MILALIVMNGVFAGAEIAVVSLRASRLAQRVEEGSRAAAAVQRLRDQPERFLATVQVGITIVSATAAAFGGASIAARLAPGLEELGLSADAAGSAALALVIVGVSYLSIVLGELVPKSLALRHAERYALMVGRLLVFIGWLARPFIWLLTASSNALLRPFGDRTTFTEAHLSSDELQRMVEEAAEAGAVDSRTGEIASRALDFGDLEIAEVMVPRNFVHFLELGRDLEAFAEPLVRHGHTRMPVFEGSRDNVIGYVTVRDVLAARLRGVSDPRGLVRPVWFVPERARAVTVFEEMQRRHMRIAVVVDEHGAVAGIVTLEDLLEELVGELFSEDEGPETTARTIATDDDGSAVLRGDTPVREVNRALDTRLDDDAASTLGGLCMVIAGGIPAKGTVLAAADGTHLEVVDASPRLVRFVRVTPRGVSIQPPG